jgi:L-ascorbate metabolism protein UlaG (beta-lactamase superfamily)
MAAEPPVPERITARRARELDAAHRRIPVDRHRSMILHWLGRMLRAPRPAALEPLPRVSPGQLSITFGGHATALLRWAGGSVVFDPMLGRWIKGVRRAVEPGLSPADLEGVSVILISHSHLDHLHVPTLRRLSRNATVVVPPGGARHLADMGFSRVLELSVGGDLAIGGLQITAAPMSHGDDVRARGVSYIVRGDGPSAFLCGDGRYFSGFAEVGARHQPDVALLPIGGFLPKSFRARHMSPLDALYAFEDLRARLMIPIHHGAFALSYERLTEPVRWLKQLVRDRGLDHHVRVLAPGESEVFVAPRERALASTGDPDEVAIEISDGVTASKLIPGDLFDAATTIELPAPPSAFEATTIERNIPVAVFDGATTIERPIPPDLDVDHAVPVAIADERSARSNENVDAALAELAHELSVSTALPGPDDGPHAS